MAGKFKNGSDCNIVGISVSRNEKRGKEVIRNNLIEYADRFSRELPYGWEKEIFLQMDIWKAAMEPGQIR